MVKLAKIFSKIPAVILPKILVASLAKILTKIPVVILTKILTKI